MVVVDFCLTEDSYQCLAEACLGITPVLVFLVFGFFSYRETKVRTAYVRQKYTFRHLSKLILSVLLAFVSFIFLVVYNLLEPEISLKTELSWGVSCLLWIFNSILIRNEYKSLGYTTNYLRVCWIAMFLCHGGLLGFEIMGANTDRLWEVIAIYVANEVFILAIIIVGYSYSDDYPPQRSSVAYGTLLSNDSVVNINDEHYKNLATPLTNRPAKTREDSSFKPFVIKDETKRPPKERNNSSLLRRDDSQENSFSSDYRNLSSLTGERQKPKLLSGPSIQVNLREDIRLIESIEIKGHEEVKRFDKNTTVYVIEFFIKGQQFNTKRSYSEVVALRQEIKKDVAPTKLPKIPSKTYGTKKDEDSIEKRISAFNILLKFLAKEKLGLNHLATFLQSPTVLPYYGKGKKNKKVKDQTNSPTNKIKPEQKNEAKAKVLDSSAGKGLNRTIIPNYTHGDSSRNQSLTPSSKYYVVETLDTFEGEKSTYYKLNIRDKETGMEHNITKRYNDFKTFHEDLKKNVSSKDKKLVPELPYKENVKGFAWRDDTRVIEFRKVALKTYLQNILNNPKLQNNSVVRKFIMAQSFCAEDWP